MNNRVARKGDFVHDGDTVEADAADSGDAIRPNPDLPLIVLFEDPAVIVVQKPGLLPCHPLRKDERGTIMNAVVARYPETSRVGDKPLEGGLVHRLDNGTSGALMIARTPESFLLMRSAIRSGRIRREYLALAGGKLDHPVETSDRIAHHPRNPRKMVTSESGRAAFTTATPLRAFVDSTLLSVMPRTGSRHQIRVHLAGLGLPIIGDLLYNGPATSRLPAGRFWLHLSAIEFDSPAGRHIRVGSPLPSDLQGVLDELS